ncbi:hypothetical protein DWU98_20260 [Dyella monticola]|uniref:Uncharacterized protein n=1 Tax=Dyella monticola TaxID=1927958 RepID=A0A370WS67_9GAMM|nr:hypothetical protein [Dyella monticola]RDS78953.1 hypothetical protein DWU98_20260 [Dyella monticola]
MEVHPLKFYIRKISTENTLNQMVEVGLADEQGATFAFRCKKPTAGARSLNGYLLFPQRTEISIFHGSVSRLKALCSKKNVYEIIRDPRFEHTI